MIAYEAPEERILGLHQLADYHTTRLKTWIGGYRESPEAWSEPNNWYPAGVPELTDKVIVGGYGTHRCFVAERVDEVSALAILPSAKVVVGRRGGLTVDGTLADPLGLLGDSGLSNAGLLHNDGLFEIRNAAVHGIMNRGLFINRGLVRTDRSVTDADEYWGKFIDLGVREYRP